MNYTIPSITEKVPMNRAIFLAGLQQEEVEIFLSTDICPEDGKHELQPLRH